MPLSSKAADRTCRVGPTARVLEPPLHTVGGRQTGDLRRKYHSALIRKAKLPRDHVEGRPFWQGWPKRRIERPTRRGRWLMRRILVVDDDLHTRLAR